MPSAKLGVFLKKIIIALFNPPNNMRKWTLRDAKPGFELGFGLQSSWLSLETQITGLEAGRDIKVVWPHGPQA